MLNSPQQERIGVLEQYKSEDDEYVIKDKEVFLLFHRSIRKSKVANNLHKLEVTSTVRNWKTLNKLVALARDMDK